MSNKSGASALHLNFDNGLDVEDIAYRSITSLPYLINWDNKVIMHSRRPAGYTMDLDCGIWELHKRLFCFYVSNLSK